MLTFSCMGTSAADAIGAAGGTSGGGAGFVPGLAVPQLPQNADGGVSSSSPHLKQRSIAEVRYMPVPANGIASICCGAHVAGTNSGASSSGGGGMGGVSPSPCTLSAEEEVEPSSRGEASGGPRNVPLPVGSAAMGLGDSKRSGNREALAFAVQAIASGMAPSTGNGIAILHRQSISHGPLLTPADRRCPRGERWPQPWARGQFGVATVGLAHSRACKGAAQQGELREALGSAHDHVALLSQEPVGLVTQAVSTLRVRR